VRAEAEKLGMNTVYVNFYGLLSVTEAADRIEKAYRTRLHAEKEIGRRLAWLLDLPVKIMDRTGNPTLVVFDEFQDVLLTKPPLDGLIRSRLEQHEAEASYIFAGSHPGMMHRLFEDRTRPFYGQARAVRLDPLLALWIAGGRQGLTDSFDGAEE
jgi:hypothetical protein